MKTNSILIIKDASTVDRFLAKTIMDSGYSVSSTDAIDKNIDKLPLGRYSMVIIDEPKEESLCTHLVEFIKHRSSDIPVIVFSRNPTLNGAVEAVKNGASDYLSKSSSPELVEAVLKKYVKNESQCQGNGGSACQDKKGELKKHVNTFITQDKKLEKILMLAKTVGPGDATVLIQGESGTGKELLAEFVHRHSGRRKMVAINCAALPESLAESELFGSEKGAFTGAVRRRVGKFEQANNGTLLLDEIGEMPLNLQAKLLRAIQQRQIDRIGGDQPIQLNTKIIATTNVDLEKAVEEGKFREDLFYRISVIPILVPPLRERREDIPLLIDHFIKKYCELNSKKLKRMDVNTLHLLEKRDWRGNVRELENTIERAVLLTPGDKIEPEYLFLKHGSYDMGEKENFQLGMTVREMEKKLIRGTLEKVDNNRTQAAALLGISIRTLRNKLNQYKEELEVA